MINIKVGQVLLSKWTCPICKTENLTSADKPFCSNYNCKYKSTENVEKTRVIQTQVEKRGNINKKIKDQVKNSSNRCFWCDNEFGDYVYYLNKLYQLSKEVDHVLPWIYTKDNSIENLRVSCQFCNRWKNSIIFKSIEEGRHFLKRKWERYIKTGIIEIYRTKNKYIQKIKSNGKIKEEQNRILNYIYSMTLNEVDIFGSLVERLKESKRPNHHYTFRLIRALKRKNKLESKMK